MTDADGRIQQLNTDAAGPGGVPAVAGHRPLFPAAHGAVFYPVISVQFVLSGDREHYHIAVLTSTYSYATYLGS